MTEQLSSADVAKHVRETLKLVQLGDDPAGVQNGLEFYKFFFTNYPTLRTYFKGAQEYTADDIQKSERFEKQGQRLLLAVYILANTFEDEGAFRAYARETVNRHRQFKMDPALWSAFFAVYIQFLNTRGSLTFAQEQAWKQMGEVFDSECQKHLAVLGLPHV